jgi:hypothetical protein
MTPASRQRSPDRRSSLVAAVVTLLIVGLAFAAFRTADGYHQYTDTQRDRLRAAQLAGAEDVEHFRAAIDVVTVSILNETGGTMHVYVGDIGAMRDVGNGVQTLAQPAEVLALNPHGRAPLVIRNWRNKYVTSTTSYVFLGAVNGVTLRFEDALFDQTPNDRRANMVYRATPNASDSNYRTISYDLTGDFKVGSTVAQEQDAETSTFEKAHHVDPKKYAASFESFVRSWFGAAGPDSGR